MLSSHKKQYQSPDMNMLHEGAAWGKCLAVLMGTTLMAVLSYLVRSAVAR